MNTTGCYYVYKSVGCGMGYKAAEEKIKTQENARKKAVKRGKHLAREGEYDTIIVYKVPESSHEGSCSIPCGEVVYRWEYGETLIDKGGEEDG